MRAGDRLVQFLEAHGRFLRFRGRRRRRCDRALRHEVAVFADTGGQLVGADLARPVENLLLVKPEQRPEDRERGGVLDRAKIAEGLRRHLPDGFARYDGLGAEALPDLRSRAVHHPLEDDLHVGGLRPGPHRLDDGGRTR